jgi:citrate synthase
MILLDGSDEGASSLESVMAGARSTAPPNVGAADDTCVPSLHKPADPRAGKLFDIAQANGLSGNYVALMQRIAGEAEKQLGKSLPVNATGAIVALASELGMPWNIVRGVGVIARAIGLVGHIREELKSPLAREIKTRTEEEATSHRR